MFGKETTTQLALAEEAHKRVYLCSYSKVALTASPNMTTKSLLLGKYQNMLKNLAKEWAAELRLISVHKGISSNEI